MTTLLLSHPACLKHPPPNGHPGRPDRLRAIARALEDEKFQTLAREQAPMAELDVIALAHPRDYVEQVRQASPDEGLIGLDADTTMSPGSFEAARRGAGGAGYAVDEVFREKSKNAFGARRPPPHPAGKGRPKGVLLVNK